MEGSTWNICNYGELSSTWWIKALYKDKQTGEQNEHFKKDKSPTT